MPPKDSPGYPPGTPMHREELESGYFSPAKFDTKAQTKLETHRKELIDLMGRVVGWANPIESEARIRLIDMNVDLAAARSRKAKAVKSATDQPAQESSTPSPKMKTKTQENAMETVKGKEKEVAVESCDEESDCSMPEDEFEATLTPYIKETLQSTLNTKVQAISAQCAAEGIPVPDRNSVVCRALKEIREKIEEDAEAQGDGDDERLVSDIALKILEEFSIKQTTLPARPKLKYAKTARMGA